METIKIKDGEYLNKEDVVIEIENVTIIPEKTITEVQSYTEAGLITQLASIDEEIAKVGAKKQPILDLLEKIRTANVNAQLVKKETPVIEETPIISEA